MFIRLCDERSIIELLKHPVTLKSLTTKFNKDTCQNDKLTHLLHFTHLESLHIMNLKMDSVSLEMVNSLSSVKVLRFTNCAFEHVTFTAVIRTKTPWNRFFHGMCMLSCMTNNCMHAQIKFQIFTAIEFEEIVYFAVDGEPSLNDMIVEIMISKRTQKLAIDMCKFIYTT